MPFAPKTPNTPHRSGGFFRPVLYILCALLSAHLLLSEDYSLNLPENLKQFQPDAAAAEAFLQQELGSRILPKISWTSLLSYESALLRYTPVVASNSPEAVPSVEKPASSPAPAAPSVMSPVLPSQPVPTSSPEPTAAVDGDERNLPVPDKNDPDANPVREITLLPQSDGKYLKNGAVVVNNDTSYDIDVKALLSRKSALKKADAQEPQILIIHTHGSESFLPDNRNYYIPTDIERTEDTRYNVVRLGDEMTKLFTEMGLSVLHDRHIHDYPSYANSYVRSLECVTKTIEEHPSIQIVLDIHRDSISTQDGTLYKTVSETETGKVAQMMFVVGSNANGLPHDGWKDNLSFAVKMQDMLLAENPTLMRPIHLRTQRFNQHATAGSLILEVGTAGNSLTEALDAAALFCQTTGPYFKECFGIS